MTIFRLLAGLIGAAVAAAVWLALGVMLPMALRVLVSADGPGREAVAAVFGGPSIAVAAIVGFAGGFYWYARSRPRRPTV